MTRTHKLHRSILATNIATQLPVLKRLIFANSQLIFDLSDVNNIDSAGIAFLIDLKNIAANKACSLEFTNPSTQIINLCQLYKITL